MGDNEAKKKESLPSEQTTPTRAKRVTVWHFQGTLRNEVEGTWETVMEEDVGSARARSDSQDIINCACCLF